MAGDADFFAKLQRGPEKNVGKFTEAHSLAQAAALNKTQL